MAYFTVKRDIAPVSFGLERKEIRHPKFEFTKAFVETEVRMLGWATNTNLTPATYSLIIKAFALSTGAEIFSHTESRELPANMTAELFDIALPMSDEALIFSSCLKSLPSDVSEGVVIARCTNWPQPYRYLEMPKPKLNICLDGDRIFASSNIPVKGLAFYVEDVDGVKFEDNLIDLVPGDEQVVIAHGLNARPVTWRYYGMEEEF